MPPPRNLTHDSEGNLLKSPEEIATRWYTFLKSKFSATQKEANRAPMPPLPSERSPSDSLTRKEFDIALKRLGCEKTSGPDGIPIEVFKFSEVARDELFAFLQQVWEDEKLPQNFPQAKFVMLFKNKGSHKDPSKYRCIGLLNHSYKILSIIILMRLLQSSEGFLPDWQAGFRAGRGCRDNSFILRTLCDRVMALGESIAITFIDYTAAFDTVSHKFLDEALAEAGAPIKVRAMFRAVYSSASAFTTVPASDGRKVKSDVFGIRRGVVQGDITSPLYFILALELILRRHDAIAGKGASLGSTTLHSLGYADDVALIDQGDQVGIQRATARVTGIANGSRDDTDMEISVPKTKVLHVRRQDSVSSTTSDEAKKVCKHICPHLNCGHRFLTKRGAMIHAGRCKWANEFVVERILDCEGVPTNRKYLIKWEGYSNDHNTWEPRRNIHPAAIIEFEKANGFFDQQWQHRCPICEMPMKSAHGIKIHCAKVHKTEKEQDFKGRLVDRAVQQDKLVKQQAHRPHVYCEGKQLDNVFKFGYLGTLFAADGDQRHDIERRLNLAKARCGKLRHLFDSPVLSLHLKLRLYRAAICSLITYGCETWRLDIKTIRMLNNANSIMLSRITGNSIPHEARPMTTSYNLVRCIRIIRYKFVGSILRSPTLPSGENRLTYLALAHKHEINESGSILMDVPTHSSLITRKPHPPSNGQSYVERTHRNDSITIPSCWNENNGKK